MENTLTKSDRKFIRLEKSRIRKQFLDVKKQQELIGELYKKFAKSPEGVSDKPTEAKDAKKTQEVKIVKPKKAAGKKVALKK
jgi:hypothetical protein